RRAEARILAKGPQAPAIAVLEDAARERELSRRADAGGVDRPRRGDFGHLDAGGRGMPGLGRFAREVRGLRHLAPLEMRASTASAASQWSWCSQVARRDSVSSLRRLAASAPLRTARVSALNARITCGCAGRWVR